MDKFLLTEDHVPSYDLFAADDAEEYNLTGNEPEVSPAKMINSIQSILNTFHAFSLKVADKYQEVMDLVQELDNVDLGDFFNRTNQRNKLIKNMLQNLSEMNGVLYQNTIPGSHALREQYYQIVENCAELLPDHIANRLLATIKPRKGKGKMQSALENSLHGIDKYDPAKDPAMKFQSPHVKNYIAPVEPEPFKPKELSLEERVDQKLRHQELADVSQRPGHTLSPEEKTKYEKLWRESQARNKIVRLAKYYQSKLC
jgi:hypothetical protein